MQHIYIIVSLAFFITACSNSRQSKGSSTENQFAIAYNVAVKDAKGKSNYEVFTMHADGSNKKNISNHPDVAWTYRAAGKRLFFISDRDTCYRCFFLYETDVNGNSIKKICNLQLEDSWMDSRNDGDELVVSGREGKYLRYQLFLINTRSGQYRQLTHDTAARFQDPAFSPDGNQLAFSYRKNKRDQKQHEEIYCMNADGSNMRQLSHYPQENISRNENGYKAGATQWHATENFITFISMQDGRHNIFAVSTDGKKQWKLTDNDFSEGYHDWSKDGKWLVFDMANKTETQYHIMLMDWKTKKITQLTDTLHKYQQSPVIMDMD